MSTLSPKNPKTSIINDWSLAQDLEPKAPIKKCKKPLSLSQSAVEHCFEQPGGVAGVSTNGRGVETDDV